MGEEGIDVRAHESRIRESSAGDSSHRAQPRSVPRGLRCAANSPVCFSLLLSRLQSGWRLLSPPPPSRLARPTLPQRDVVELSRDVTRALAVWYLETRGQFINTEHGEETGGFSDGDDRVNKEDLQAESEERLRAYHCSLRPAEACHPQGDHPVTASCAEVEVVLEDMNKEPRIKQELEDNTGSAVWMAAKVEHKPFSQSALQHWETRGSFIKMECGEETAGFSEGDHQAKKEDLQAESEESLRAYRSSLRPAEACHPQGDHPVTASCAEVEVELEDIQEGSARLACDICGRSYASQDSLQRHAQLHEGYVGTKRHRCRLSPYAMEFVAEPHQHKKAHDGALLHGCGECGRAFTMASQLKVHLRVHAVKKSNYVG